MKKIAAAALLVIAATVALFAQATRITSSGTLPATCVVGSIYVKTGTSAGLYGCITTDTWTGPYATSAGTTVEVDAAGALDGDGSMGDPLAVIVDGVTIDINGSNELEVIAASDIGIPQYVFKTANESVTNNSIQSDDHLVFAIAANEKWEIEYSLNVTGQDAADFKVCLNVPTGATGSWSTYPGVHSGTATTQTNATIIPVTGTTLTDGCGFAVATVDEGAFTHVLKAIIFNSSNAGNVTLRWAQNNTNASPTTVNGHATLPVSWLKATRFE